MVEKKITAMVISVFSIRRAVCFSNTTLPDIPTDNIAANNATLASAGTINNNKLAMVTFSSKKIISVVTSPVINDTPPELTLNTIKVAYFINFLGSNFSDITTASEIKVAVMLSDIDENKNAKPPIRNISFRSLI